LALIGGRFVQFFYRFIIVVHSLLDGSSDLKDIAQFVRIHLNKNYIMIAGYTCIGN
jgi:hypothetical protein